MLVGNRLFPYPTLNHNVNLTEYIDSSFTLNLTLNEDGSLIRQNDCVILKDVKFILQNKKLQELYDYNKVKCALIVECSSSLYRERFEIRDTPKDIIIPINDLKDNVIVSSYMYANEDIADFRSEKFSQDYLDYTFSINKFDILAIDDGFKFNIDIDTSEDNKVSSIFLIIKKDDNSDVITYQKTSSKINIYLSEQYYRNYDTVKNNPKFNNIFFSMLVIPALSNSLKELQVETKDFDDIDDIFEICKWFKAICISYEKVKNQPLSIDTFRECNCLEIAQIVLNNSSCYGLKDFCDFILNGSGSEDDDE